MIAASPDLRGRVALVTGASSGIGREVALRLARHGAHVAVNHPDAATAAGAAATVAAIHTAGGMAFAAMADVRSEDAVRAMIGAVEQAQGRLDILINNAGVARYAPITELGLDDWDAVIDTNLRGTFLCLKHALPGMLAHNHGRIVNTISGLAFRGRPQCAAYAASKAGILGLMRTAVTEIGSREVTVNCIAPTVTWTELNAHTRTPEKEREIAGRNPKGRAGTIDDLLPAYLFCVDPANAYFTGQCLAPNGGDVMA